MLVATPPWADEVPTLRRALRAALPATTCSLAMVAPAFRRGAATVAEGVGLVALRLPRPVGAFGPEAVAAVTRAVAEVGAGPSPDALDLVQLLDGDDDEESPRVGWLGGWR